MAKATDTLYQDHYEEAVGSNHDARPVNFGLTLFDGFHVGF